MTEHPLAHITDPSQFTMPDFSTEGRYAGVRKLITEYGKEYGIMGGLACPFSNFPGICAAWKRFWKTWSRARISPTPILINSWAGFAPLDESMWNSAWTSSGSATTRHAKPHVAFAAASSANSSSRVMRSCFPNGRASTHKSRLPSTPTASCAYHSRPH